MGFAEQLLAASKPNQHNKRTGLELAIVTNIDDPDGLGRVKVKPVSESTKVKETDWCFCMTPAGGNDYGLFFFPNVDDQVIISYIDGEVHRPIVLGSRWNNSVAAPYKIEDDKNEVISIRTPTHSELKFEDEPDKQKITLTTPSGAIIHIDDEAKTITIKGNDDNQMTMKWEDGEIELKAATKLTLSAGDTKITLESSGTISGEASQEVGFKAANVNLKGDSSFAAEGATAEVKASGTLTLEASGKTTLKGSLVQIN